MALPASTVTTLVRPVSLREKFGSHDSTSPVGLEPRATVCSNIAACGLLPRPGYALKGMCAILETN